ncbi:MAG: hypothetical protein K2O14_15475, partial [Oscillospiraceae bacterium]|nr:hypothetical protein [Oscillospiraceae bacterium]
MPIAAVLLAAVFALGQDDTVFGYFSFLFSAYALTILCARIPVAFKKCSAFVHRSSTAHRYLTDIPYRVKLSLYMSLGINIVYAGVKMFAGVYYRSVWFVSLSVYYIMLALMRFLLLRHNNSVGENYAAELKRYRLCGGAFLIMNIALSGITALVVYENEGFEYAGTLIYVMAAYTFYTTILSIVNLVKYRKFKSPLLVAAKAVNLTAALVSMLSLE